ncbi:MAG: RHS repeat-associated core domain-containing protein [Planctomycetes bacterium]|nr:RHS repeat-associated core domain-containing protein [Planctomycetota bacterium]
MTLSHTLRLRVLSALGAVILALPGCGTGERSEQVHVAFAPIAGLTTTPHRVPLEGLPVPVGAEVELRLERDGLITAKQRYTASTAGKHTVEVRDSKGSRTVVVEGVHVPVGGITVRHAARSSTATYAGGSVSLHVETSPPQFVRIAEWFAMGASPTTGFGPSFTTTPNAPGNSGSSAGPQGSQIRASVGVHHAPSPIRPIVYTVHWVAKPSKRDYFAATPVLRLYHEIRTNPPGYEHLVPWSYDTTGTAAVTATSGTGKSFCIVRTNNRAHPLLCWRVQAGNLVDKADFVNDLLDTPLQGRSEQPPKNRDCGPPDPSGHSLPVNLANGELKFTVTDLRVPSRGFDFVWTRSYASRANFRGPVGYNWTLAYERRVFRIPGATSVSVVDGMQREDVYQKGAGNTYVSAAGYYDSLIENNDTTFTQIDRDGTRFDYDSNGCLAAITDRTGQNSMTFLRNAYCNIEEVVDTQGRKYTLRYSDNSPTQLLTSITDFRGRTVRYEYDLRDDLIRVTSPSVVGTPTGNDFPSGKTTLYTYSQGAIDARLDHNLLSIVEPGFNTGNDPGQSKAMVTMTYAATADPTKVEFDRVIAERWGHDSGGAPSNPNVVVGGTSTFSYSRDLGSDPDAPSLAFGRTIETTRNGNVRVHYFDQSLSEIRTISRTNRNVRSGEGDYRTDYEYTSEGLLEKITYPRGNVTTMLYDEQNARREAQQNKLEVCRQVGTVGGGLTDLVTRYTYEPIYQQTRTITSPRGFPGGNVPLTANGKLDLSDPTVARHTVTFVFDYQESTGVQAARGVPALDRIPEGYGDRNGATDFDVGNLIQTIWPTIQTSGPNLGQGISEKRTWNARGQLVDKIDPTGRRKRHEYYASNNTPFDPSDREGYIAAIYEDFTGFRLTTRYEYDTSGNVTAIVDPKAQRTETIYNELNQVVRTFARPVGSARYRVDHYYSANNDRIRTETQNLDENGAAYAHATITDRAEFDILHQVVLTEKDRTRDDGSDAGSIRTDYYYDAQTNRIAVRAPAPRLGTRSATITTTLYDERELPFRSVLGDNDVDPTNAPPTDAVVRYSNYDENGNILETSDRIRQTVLGGPTPRFPAAAPGDVTQHAYDGFDRRVQTTDPEGAVVTLGYDFDSNLVLTRLVGIDSHKTGATRRTLQESTAVFDEIDRVVRREVRHFDAMGSNVGDGSRTKVTKYDAESKVLWVEDDRGNRTTTTWDTADRVSVVTDALGNTVTSEYDANSNLVKTTRVDSSSGAGSGVEIFVTTFTYDGLDRLRSTVDPDSSVHERYYDSRSNVVQTSDAVRGSGSAGNIVRFHRDALDRVWKTVSTLTSTGRGDGAPAGSITTVSLFDDDSLVASRTDDNGTRTQYRYDRLGRLVELEYGDLTKRTTQYNSDNQVASWTDQNGTSATMSYDGLGRMYRRNIVKGSGVLGASYEQFGFDALSRTTLAQNDDGFGATAMRCEFEYDSLQNIVTDQQGPWRVQNVFDGMSNRMVCTYHDSFGTGTRVLTSTFDALNRLATISEGSSVLARYDYKGPSRVERRRLGVAPVLTCTTTYDAIPRPIVLDHQTSTATVARFEYGYDRAHHRLFEKRVHDGNLGEIYNYDSIYRVVREERGVDLTSVAAGARIAPEAYRTSNWQSWFFDGAHNRATSIDTIGGTGTTTTWTRSAGTNQYASRKVGSASPETFTWDNNGNLLDDGVRRYGYDFKNRLVEVRNRSTNAVLVRYSYDAMDRRAFKVVDPLGTTPATTHYVYDGSRILEEHDGSGALQKSHVWGVAPDELLQVQTGSAATQTFWVTENSLGNIAALVDDAGTIVERYAYDAFGKTSVPLNGSTGNEYRFQTTRLDPETGLYWFRARHYSPELGRFLQKDPIGIWTDGANLGNGYAFAANDLVNGVDPTGMWPDWLDNAWYEVKSEAAWAADFAGHFVGGVASDVGNAASGAAHAVMNPGETLQRIKCAGSRMWDRAMTRGELVMGNGGSLLDGLGQVFGSLGGDLTGASGMIDAYMGVDMGNYAMTGNWDQLSNIERWQTGLNGFAQMTGILAGGGAGGEAMHFKTFYSVQDAADRARWLRNSGRPFPTAANKAHLGEGLYAWETRASARNYLTRLEGNGATDLGVLRHRIPRRDLRSMNTMDLTRLPDAAQNSWLNNHSRLWNSDAVPHGFDRVRRGTQFGNENFFDVNVLPQFGHSR